MCILLESPSVNVCFNQVHLGSSGSVVTTLLLYTKHFAPNYAGVAMTKMLKIMGRTMRSSHKRNCGQTDRTCFSGQFPQVVWIIVFFFLLYDPCRIFFLLLTHTMTWALSWPKNSTVKCCTSIAGVRVQVPFIKLKTGRIIHLKDYYYWSGETNIIIKPKLIVSFDFVPKSGKFGGVESAHELKHFFGKSHCVFCVSSFPHRLKLVKMRSKMSRWLKPLNFYLQQDISGQG